MLQEPIITDNNNTLENNGGSVEMGCLQKIYVIIAIKYLIEL